MKELSVPFNKPYFTGKEMEYIRRVFSEGSISGGGPFAQKCQELLGHQLGALKVILTTSCTHALEISSLLLDVQPQDEIIMPSFTYVSTVNSYVLRGARPVFIDIRPDTLNMDESLLEGSITPRTKAILPVHYAGTGCEMDAISGIASRYGIPVVEDNAHGVFGKYKGKYLGTLGCLGALSFHGTKHLTCGEGGALIINDSRYIDRSEVICEKGTDRARFIRGETDSYTWVDIGSSYMPSDILAAFLYAQLEESECIIAERRRSWYYYLEHIKDWASNNGIHLHSAPSYCEHTFHMFYLLMGSRFQRDRLMSHLEGRGIGSAFHFQPLHLSKMARLRGWDDVECPVTEDASARLLRLPLYNGLTETEQNKVIDALLEFV